MHFIIYYSNKGGICRNTHGRVPDDTAADLIMLRV